MIKTPRYGARSTAADRTLIREIEKMNAEVRDLTPAEIRDLQKKTAAARAARRAAKEA